MFNIRNFLKISSPLNVLCRLNHGKHNKKYLYRDGKLINGSIYYYPRQEKEVDPEITPSKLFRVHRLKPLKGIPHWGRQILRELGLFGPGNNVTVVKNIPENNARLWKIKHLIKITPINFPNGEPTADDLNYTYLKENGDCVVIKNIESLNQRLEAAEKKDKNELDIDTMKKESRLRWLNNW